MKPRLEDVPLAAAADPASVELKLPPRVAVALAELGSTEEYRCGDVVFEAGSTGSCMYVVEEGAIDLVFDGGPGRKRLHAGEYFGELSLIVGDHRRTASAVAAGATRLRVVGQTDFAILLESLPAVSVELLRETCRYLLQSERELVASLARRNRELSQTLDYLRRTKEDLDARQLEARTDGLTGLYNRRCLDEQSVIMLRRSVDGRRALMLILIDIDRFKLINDRCGHPVGDEVLKSVARLLHGAVRQTDLPCRIGGDEFAVLALDLEEGSARSLTTRLVEAVRGLQIPGPTHDLNVTCSIGGARLRPGETWEELLARADDNLYRAKQSGTDRDDWG